MPMNFPCIVVMNGYGITLLTPKGVKGCNPVSGFQRGKPFGGFGQSPKPTPYAIAMRETASDAHELTLPRCDKRVWNNLLNPKRGQGMQSLVRFPKGETLWWVWAKPKAPSRSEARGGGNMLHETRKWGQGPLADYHYKCNTKKEESMEPT